MPSIFDAISKGDPVLVGKIIDSDSSQLEKKNVIDDYPLHEAIRQGQEDVVRVLLEKGANPNAAGSQGFTALHYVAQENAPGLCELLIQHGANLESKDFQDRTPLYWACRNSPSLATILIRNGAKTDLNTAIILNDYDTIHSLLSRGTDLTKVAQFPEQLLEDAMSTGSREVFELLLNGHQQPNAIQFSRPPSLLFRAIEYAMNRQDTFFLRRLLDAGAATNVKNEFGEHPSQFIAQFSAGRGSHQAEIKNEIIKLLTSVKS